jgi:hypothetical protein
MDSSRPSPPRQSRSFYSQQLSFPSLLSLTQSEIETDMTVTTAHTMDTVSVQNALKLMRGTKEDRDYLSLSHKERKERKKEMTQRKKDLVERMSNKK